MADTAYSIGGRYVFPMLIKVMMQMGNQQAMSVAINIVILR